jgi:ribosomal protein S18 acetylase RimI-like enzyme
MPAKSKKQQQFMGIVYKCKNTGDCPDSKIKEVAEGMSKKEIRDIAKTKHKGLPKKVKRKKNKKSFISLRQLIKIANELDNRGLVNEADFLDKIAAKESFECGEEKCSFFYVGQELDEHDIPEDIDYYEILEGVESLFKKTGIRIFRNEDFYQACVTEGGEVCGASVVGENADEFYGSTIMFSIAVSKMARRQGMAKELVENIINDFPESRIEAWVVNEEAMIPLLEGLGFDGYGGRSDPIMHLER